MIDLAILHAAWIVPVDDVPIPGGWVALANERIVACGERPAAARLRERHLLREAFASAGVDPDLAPAATVRDIDLGDVALLPGLVNAHTHLELSHLRGRVPRAPSMPTWIRELLRARAESAGRAHEIETSMTSAIREAQAAGTIALADVSNTLASVRPLADRHVPAVVFNEVLGFVPSMARGRFENARRALDACEPGDTVRLRLAPHAPYSTSADLLRLIGSEARRVAPPATSVHVAESAEEVTFLATGDGPFRELVEEVGVLPAEWRPPRLSPAAYLDRLGVWQPGALAVHGVQLTDSELELLARRDVTLVTCPRSNAWVGAGVPPLERFAAAGVRVAIGTDSLASVEDLNVFEEMRTIHRLAPSIPAREVLQWATLNGAHALGMDQDLGSLRPGRLARLLAVAIPHATSDVESALVSGIDARNLIWVN